MSVLVTVRMMVVSVMIVMQKKRAEQIDAQADGRNQNGLIESYRHRICEALHALVTYEQRDHRQNNRARKCS
jgi:hypothetical protein